MIFGAFRVVFYVIWSYKRVNKRRRIDLANQRVPSLGPGRPGSTLSSGVHNNYISHRAVHNANVRYPNTNPKTSLTLILTVIRKNLGIK